MGKWEGWMSFWSLVYMLSKALMFIINELIKRDDFFLIHSRWIRWITRRFTWSKFSDVYWTARLSVHEGRKMVWNEKNEEEDSIYELR